MVRWTVPDEGPFPITGTVSGRTTSDASNSEEILQLRTEIWQVELMEKILALNPDIDDTDFKLRLQMFGRQIGKSETRDVYIESMKDACLYGTGITEIWFDEACYIKPDKFWSTHEYVESTEKDWKRTTFKSGGSTVPSKAKRAKLRAKRKKK